MKRVFYLLYICCLFSCTDRTEFDPASVNFDELHNPTPVILSFFSPDTMVQVTISTTLPAFNRNEGSDSLYIENAIIENEETGVVKELIPAPANNNRYLSDIVITEGAVCRVSFEFPDITAQPVWATDTVPFSSKIESATVIPDVKRDESVRFSLVRLEILPALFQIESYYEISVVATVTDSVGYRGYPLDSIDLSPSVRRLCSDDPLISGEDYYPSILQFNAFLPERLYFKKRHNAQKFSVEFYYEPPSIASPSIFQVFNHNATIYLKTISKSYYNYQVSRLSQFYSREGDPLYGVGMPVNVFSNIQNGTGIFAAYTIDTLNFTSENGYIEKL